MALTDAKNAVVSWKGLVENGFEYGETKGKVTKAQRVAWKSQLDSGDLDDLLSAAEFMGRKLDAPNGDLYARWLESVFKDVVPTNSGMSNALRALKSAGIPFCTLNYDSLLERVTGLGSTNLRETGKVAAWMRREEQTILHLHGMWDSPSTCVLGIRDYSETIGDEVRDLIQRALSSFERLLFIGCGETFADPNFSALVRWLREKMKTAAPQHYALVKSADLAARHADSSWHGFVEPISYGNTHKELPAFLLNLFPTIVGTKPGGTKKRTKPTSAAAKHDQVLAEYRAFLLKDCGQMTIEGIRADMDTTGRRFDIERLFVPLTLSAIPPEIPTNDPAREQKLREWHENNKTALPFGQVFERSKHLALLALPGGGKTLLLKRLAVAYADPGRRTTSNDTLPPLDIVPVLIRCREWKEHIQRPISTILQNIPSITGQTALAGLQDALMPMLKKGNVLLLVDGLDEIHDDRDRSIFVEHLEKFLDDHKLIRLVVTSREAGFSLVAPSIARFCARWKIAPLEDGAIRSLCGYWHRLMIGDGPESLAESEEVATRLLGSASLRRLAENPLLLTMLLVVKHGAGRLPPDRVSLYNRAIEVLLDTWNIKGHEPLNLKEAVPQLACVAFEMMRAGKQTATEKDLLTRLEAARDKLPQIRRYATDAPDKFLKRVELRSSLLVEAGHQMEDGRTVPFYQFRHLTFQEHLAAVACVEGHYLEYQQGDSVRTPLAPHLTAEEWKEVVPMAAVLARKQAEPLLVSLLAEANILRKALEAGRDFAGKKEWARSLPAPVARLIQCLVEEAEASPETLTSALQLVALFARGCLPVAEWQTLVRGPYGEELLHQAWLLYVTMKWPYDSWLRNTLGKFLAYRQSEAYWLGEIGQKDLMHLLQSADADETTRGLLTLGGFHWGPGSSDKSVVTPEMFAAVERGLFRTEDFLLSAAVWSWILIGRRRARGHVPSPTVFGRFLNLWLEDYGQVVKISAAYALCDSPALPRATWTPNLTDEQKKLLRAYVDSSEARKRVGNGSESELDAEVFRIASLCTAFYAKDIWSDDELVERLQVESPIGTALYQERTKALLEQLGEPGRKALDAMADTTRISARRSRRG